MIVLVISLLLVALILLRVPVAFAILSAGILGLLLKIGLGPTGSVAKIVKLEHAWRRLDGRNDDGFQVAPFPG